MTSQLRCINWVTIQAVSMCYNPLRMMLMNWMKTLERSMDPWLPILPCGLLKRPELTCGSVIANLIQNEILTASTAMRQQQRVTRVFTQYDRDSTELLSDAPPMLEVKFIHFKTELARNIVGEYLKDSITAIIYIFFDPLQETFPETARMNLYQCPDFRHFILSGFFAPLQQVLCA